MDTIGIGLTNVARLLSPLVGWLLLSASVWVLTLAVSAFLSAAGVKAETWQKAELAKVVADVVFGAFIVLLSGVALLNLWVPDYTVDRIVSVLVVAAGAAMLRWFVR